MEKEFENSNMDAQIDRIKRKLQEVERDFKEDDLEFESFPPVSAETVREVEKKYGFTFPLELFRFYTEIANGCPIFDGDIKKFEDLEIDPENIVRNFAFEEDWLWEGAAEGDYPLYESDPETYCADYGNIELSDQGCEGIWFIVVTGNQRGNIWHCGDTAMWKCPPP